MNNKPLSETEKKTIMELSKGFSIYEIVIILDRGLSSIIRVINNPPAELSLNALDRRFQKQNELDYYHKRIFNEKKYIRIRDFDQYLQIGIKAKRQTKLIFSELFRIKKDRTECFPRYKIEKKWIPTEQTAEVVALERTDPELSNNM